MFNTNYAMDTIQLMTNYSETLRHWIAIDRPGMVLLKRLLFGGYTNVYLLNVLSFACLILTSLMICYLVYRVLGEHYSTTKIFIIPSLFITSQLFVYQYYFVLQNFEFSLMMIVTTLSVILTFQTTRNFTIQNLFATACLIFALTVYQSFILYYVALVSFVSLLIIYRNQIGDSIVSIRNLLKLVTPYIMILFTSLIGYFVLNKVIQNYYNVPASSYLRDQSLWGTMPFKTVLLHLLGGLKVVIFPAKGDLIYNYLLLVSLILSLFVLIIQYLRHLKSKLSFFIALCTLFLSIFIMIFVAGKAPNARTLVPVYPFVVAIVVFVDSLYFTKRIGKIVLIGITAFYTFSQVNLTTNLLFADQMKYEEDQRKIERITTSIDNLGLNHPENYKLMFVGVWPSQSSLILTSDMLGLSMFQFGQFTGDSYASTINILKIMQTMGIQYQAMTHDEFLNLEPNADNMPEYPAKGSIKVVDNTIIVKLK